MRRICLLLSVLAVPGFIIAADSSSVAAPPTSPAVSAQSSSAAVDSSALKTPPADSLKLKAPVVESTPAAVNKKCAAPLSVTWYGMAQFRLREDIITNIRKTTDVVEASATYSNRIAYKLGAKFVPNDQMLFQFEIGNDWCGTDEVGGIPGNYLTKRDANTPWFSLAYAQWDPGYLHIAAGIIPVKYTALMNLLGVSIFYDRRYKSAAHFNWGDITNYSQTGIRVGAPLLTSNAFKLGVEAMSSIIQQRPAILGLDTMKMNASANEFLLEFPMLIFGLNVNPQGFAIPYRSFNKTTGKGDFEFGLGVDLGYPVNDIIKLRAGFGIAQNTNMNSYGNNDSVYIDPFDPSKGTTRERAEFNRLGTNTNLGSTIKLGPGKLDVDFNFSTEYDKKDTANVKDYYPFVDVKYGWTANKNFIIMPRCRLFFVYPKAAYNSKLTTRPELILNGTF
jgi:hypothetical protein